MKLLEHTAECDNAYQTYKECVCHVAQAKILIDALADFIEDTEAHEGSFARIRSYHKFDKLKQALQEIGYEPK